MTEQGRGRSKAGMWSVEPWDTAQISVPQCAQRKYLVPGGQSQLLKGSVALVRPLLAAAGTGTCLAEISFQWLLENMKVPQKGGRGHWPLPSSFQRDTGPSFLTVLATGLQLTSSWGRSGVSLMVEKAGGRSGKVIQKSQAAVFFLELVDRGACLRR
jgi:hypothetical protein